VLHLDFFEHRLDGQIHVTGGIQVCRRGDAVHDDVAIFLEFAFLHEFAHRPGDIPTCAFQRLFGYIVQENPDSGLGAHLGNAAAHQSRTRHQNVVDRHWILLGRSPPCAFM
jgi:hypothetical protein